MQLHRLFASCGGIGYIRGGGTLAALLYGAVWYLLPPIWHQGAYETAMVLFLLVVGTWSSHQVEAGWGKDSSRVVVDELAGMAVSLYAMPHHWSSGVGALVLFRFFDIVKPLGIRRMERWKGGWGVMADDVLSGVYAWLLLQALIRWMPGWPNG